MNNMHENITTSAISIGSNIKQMRQKFGLNQSVIADLMGISFAKVSNWENGKKVPRMEEIERLCQIFNCKKESLLGLNYPDSKKDAQLDKLQQIYDNLSESNRQLLLIRAKELSNIEQELFVTRGVA